MNSIEQRVQAAVERGHLLTKGERVLIAYSGGPDSTFLLLMLSAVWPAVAAVYVNHHLRGAESDAEEAFVSEFCRSRNIPLFVEHIHWRKKPSNLEEAARKRRYRHLAKVAAEHSFDKVALGHHANDIAETFLLRLIRGTGPAGLAAMASKRGIYIRPLLEFTRAEILEYLQSNNIPFLTDSSNSDLSLQRNRIRQELLPYMEKHFNPRISQALVRSARWIAEQNEYLGKCLTIYDEFKHGDQVQREPFLELAVPVQKALLRRWIHQADPHLHVEARMLAKLLIALKNNENLALPGYLMVESSRDFFRFARKTGEIGFCEIDVPAPGSYFFPPANAVLVFSFGIDEQISGSPIVASVDAEKATFPLHIRNWKKGDRFHPLGMSGRKKLSDFWIDRKVPRTERKKIPLVFKEDDLIWIAGYHLDHDYRITDRTRKVLQITMTKNV